MMETPRFGHEAGALYSVEVVTRLIDMLVKNGIVAESAINAMFTKMRVDFTTDRRNAANEVGEFLNRTAK